MSSKILVFERMYSAYIPEELMAKIRAICGKAIYRTADVVGKKVVSIHDEVESFGVCFGDGTWMRIGSEYDDDGDLYLALQDNYVDIAFFRNMGMLDNREYEAVRKAVRSYEKDRKAQQREQAAAEAEQLLTAMGYTVIPPSQEGGEG